jgi:nitrous-oxide reductase
MAVNWKKAEEYIKAGQGTKVKAKYVHNKLDESTHMATSTMLEEVLQLDPVKLKDIVYFIPCPKSPQVVENWQR